VCAFEDNRLIAMRAGCEFLTETVRHWWSLFTPCKLVRSLLEAVSEAASSTTSGDVVLFSPPRFNFDLVSK